MKDLKRETKPEVRKGQIRSFTAKNNTINRKTPKSKSVKAPILAIKKNKKNMKKKTVSVRKSGEIKKKKIVEKKIIVEEKKVVERKKKMNKPKPEEKKEESEKKKEEPEKKKQEAIKEVISEDEVEYEQVSGVNERRRRQ